MQLYNIHSHTKNKLDLLGYDVSELINVYPRQLQMEGVGEQCCYSCGIHPWYSYIEGQSLVYLLQLAHLNKVRAIGEIGLDKLRGPDIALQEHMFVEQIAIANSVCKPIVIHCVKAWDELIRIRKTHQGHIPWIIHGFRGKPEQAIQLIDLGFYLSIGEKFNESALSVIPLDKLFLETDESVCSILDVYTSVSQSLGISIDGLAKEITKNVKSIFE